MSKSRKIFVLDTSVILYDHSAINCFQEHNVAIPIHVLDELDNFKKGNDTKNFEAREFIRLIDHISDQELLTDWVPLEGKAKGDFKVVASHDLNGVDATHIFDDKKYDHQIINAALSLKREHPERKVILVSKDICLRLKAKSLDIDAEDYLTGKVKDVRQLYTGRTVQEESDPEVIDDLFEHGTLPGEALWCY